MLRTFVIAIGVAALLISAAIGALWPVAWVAALEVGLFGAVILIGTLFERHYRFRRTAGGPHWQRTGERFIDPTSGELIEVRYEPTSGERAYVDIDGTANKTTP